MKELSRAYWNAALAYRWRWAVVVLGHTVFFAFNGVVTPYIYSQFVQAVANITNSTTVNDFYPIIIAMVSVHIIQTSTGQAALYSLRHAMPKSMKFLEDHAFAHMMKKSAGFYASNFTGSLVTKFNRYIRAFQVIAESIVFDLLDLLIQFIFPFIFMAFVAPQVAIAFLIFAIVMATSLFWMHRKKIPYSRAVAAQESKKTGVLADSVTNILSIKTFSSRRKEESLYRTESKKWVALSYRNSTLGNWIRLYKIVIWTINEALIMFFVAKLAIDGSLSIGNATAILLFIRQLSMSVWNFGKLIEKIEQSAADATEMVEILNEPIAVSDPKKPRSFAPKKGGIDIENIDFAYEDLGSSNVFSAMNLSIKPRQKVGLVGPSGGGKTTFVKLLLRFADVQSGVIKIDGQDISKIAQDDLRSAIAYVPQEPILFHRTIAENITYGINDVSDKKLAEITRLSHVDEFIDDLPQGLNTMVGERGVKLSGGQKQRIAIARAMLKPAPILLLDEATSALDSKSEKLIIDALDNLMKGRTTIVIAHRLSTIKKLDRIVVLDKGMIKEDGSHSELVKKKSGIYANLWKHQMGNFID